MKTEEKRTNKRLGNTVKVLRPSRNLRLNDPLSAGSEGPDGDWETGLISYTLSRWTSQVFWWALVAWPWAIDSPSPFFVLASFIYTYFFVRESIKNEERERKYSIAGDMKLLIICSGFMCKVGDCFFFLSFPSN